MLDKGQMFSSLSNAWFPVALSRQFRPGQHEAVRRFGTQLLLFRTRSGRAAMTSRYFCHLGMSIKGAEGLNFNPSAPFYYD